MNDALLIMVYLGGIGISFVVLCILAHRENESDYENEDIPVAKIVYVQHS